MWEGPVEVMEQVYAQPHGHKKWWSSSSSSKCSRSNDCNKISSVVIET